MNRVPRIWYTSQSSSSTSAAVQVQRAAIRSIPSMSVQFYPSAGVGGSGSFSIFTRAMRLRSISSTV